MPDKLNLAEVIEQLGDQEEDRRYKALVAIREAKVTPTKALLQAIERLENDPSRPVRQLARDLLEHDLFERDDRAEAGEGRGKDDLPRPLEPDDEPYPGSFLLALLAWGSCFTGVALIGLSLTNYYTLGKFPFPNPIEVLTTVFIGATLPFFVVGVMLLTPGRSQKRLALYFAYLAIIVFALLSFTLGPIFERYWAVQFTLADQQRFRHFLSPFQLAMLFLPIFAGQGMLVYYLTIYLNQGDARQSRNQVDSADGSV